MNARAHDRLRDEQPLGGTDEIAGGDDAEKGARELGFHLDVPQYRSCRMNVRQYEIKNAKTDHIAMHKDTALKNVSNDKQLTRSRPSGRK